ncbi:hypothetical protein HXV90_18560 [Lysinibacillus sp. JK80]|uniref:hypothetical protein n=1 Tax=Lysinibacillus sp. JK80 TaxID=2749809 RepID=UPI0022B97CF1|nr:hypothetical protein [Lysinibacillus sp. JK80]WBF57678.1 hypothetical protein HXV90_18560 [Lysinibacillus sp. JK80]
MNKEKIESKYINLMNSILKGEQCEQDELKLFAVQIKGNRIHLYGPTSTPLPLLNGILLSDIGNKIKFYGSLNGTNYSLSENGSDMVTIIIDLTKENNPKIYIEDGELNYISSKSTFGKKDKLYFYWQYGVENFLLLINYDPQSGAANIKDICYQSSEYLNEINLITQNVHDYMLEKMNRGISDDC